MIAEFYNKHYIRLNADNCIIKGFSDAFESPQETDICINVHGGRHFELNGEINPILINISGAHLYKYVDGAIIETTEEERAAETALLPKPSDPIAEYMIDLDYRLSKIELGV